MQKNEKNAKEYDNTKKDLVITEPPKLNLNNLPKDEVFKIKRINKLKSSINSFYNNKIKGKLNSKMKYI